MNLYSHKHLFHVSSNEILYETLDERAKYIAKNKPKTTPLVNYLQI